VDLSYKEVLEKPIEQEVYLLTKPAGIAIMKAFGKDGRAVKASIEALPQSELEKIATTSSPATVEVEGKSFEVKPELMSFEKKKEKISVNAFTPGVIEPSFGIDRILTVVLEHAYYARPKDESGDDKQTRGVLSLSAVIAPYKCTLLPLDQRIARHEKYLALSGTFKRELSVLGLSYTIDESGATIGRRYARNDELGIPFAVTFDFTTLEDSTVTMRERDSMEQIRLPLSEAADLIRNLCIGDATWANASPKYKTT